MKIPRPIAVLQALLWILIPFASAVRATGPSYVEIQIIPIAANTSGIVLFKTKKFANHSGGYSLLAETAEYGWLCASSRSLWKEHVGTRVAVVPVGPSSKDLDLDREKSLRDEFERAESAFKAGVDFDQRLPEALSAFVEKCGRGPWRKLDAGVGKGRAIWSPRRFCVDGVCQNGYVEQRTLGRLGSSQETGERIESTFFYEGLALFENFEHFVLPAEGAYFSVENHACKKCEFDSQRISGIVLLPD